MIGDASLRVTLDPEAARREAARFREEMRKIEEQRRKMQEDMERQARGEPATFVHGANPNQPGGGPRPHPNTGVPASAPQKGVLPESEVGDRVREKLDEMAETADKATGGIAGFLKGVIKVGFTAGKQAPLLTEALKSAAEGTVFEDLTRKFDAMAQDLSARLLTLEANLDAIPDTKTDVIDYSAAILRLGGVLSPDQVGLVKDFHAINTEQLRLKKIIDLEVQRELIRNLPPAFAAAFNQ